LDIGKLVRNLEEQGVKLLVESEQLRFHAGEGTVTEEQTSRIAANAAGILDYLRVRAATPEKCCELSYGQQAIWFTHQLEPESSVHNLSFVARVHSEVNIAALKSAVQTMVDRHEILRTSYVYVDGVIRQKIAQLGSAVFKVERIPSKTDEELDAIVQAEHRQPFDLARGLVFRVSLLAQSDTDQILILSLHHISIDGWSYTIFLDELFALYAEAAGGGPAILNKLSLDYSDYCNWQCLQGRKVASCGHTGNVHLLNRGRHSICL
jgi:condensation domain-containing protein/tubulysin polyketide synthase-like protein